MSWLSSAIKGLGGIAKKAAPIAGLFNPGLGAVLGAAGNIAAGNGTVLDNVAPFLGGEAGTAYNAIRAGNRADGLIDKQREILGQGAEAASKAIGNYNNIIGNVTGRYNTIANGGDPYTSLGNGLYSQEAIDSRLRSAYDGTAAREARANFQGKTTDAAARGMIDRLAPALSSIARTGYTPQLGASTRLRLGVQANRDADAQTRDYDIQQAQARVADTVAEQRAGLGLRKMGADTQLGAIDSLASLGSDSLRAGLGTMTGLGGMFQSQILGDTTLMRANNQQLGGKNPYTVLGEGVLDTLGIKKKRKQSGSLGTSNAGSSTTSAFDDYDRYILY